MFKYFILFVFLYSSLVAAPALAQVKQAVQQNPALLETPQAKAMMQEKGVSLSEVKQKLAEDGSASKESSSEGTTENTIDTSVEESEKSDDTLSEEDLHKLHSISKRVNPFRYKTSKQVRI